MQDNFKTELLARLPLGTITNDEADRLITAWLSCCSNPQLATLTLCPSAWTSVPRCRSDKQHAVPWMSCR